MKKQEANYKKYIYEAKNIKLILEEDAKEIGWCLIVFDDPASNVSTADYVYDSEKLAFEGAKKRFGINRDQWKLVSTLR